MEKVDEFLNHSPGLDARSSGHHVGYNYSVDTYYVELPNKKIVYWEIGGSARSFVEKVEIFTPEQMKEQQELLDIAEDINHIAAQAVNGGGPEAQKKALETLELLKKVNNIPSDFLNKSMAKEPTDDMGVLKDASPDVHTKLKMRNKVGFIGQQIEICEDWLKKTLEGKK